MTDDAGAARKRLIALSTELGLNSPILAVLRARNEVNAFIKRREIKPPSERRRHIANQLDLLELRLIFGLSLQINLGKALECGAFRTCRKFPCPLPEFIPGFTSSYEAIL